MATPERNIGHYRIGVKLGEGGMGEVWRATDTRLNREVAVKVLPAAVAGDAMRLARFTREAQVLASLNHPGIAAIYGVEERALVMELVEGPTLAEKIPRSGMPTEDALAIARQMAEALGYAHEKGVVHRDLKPANIKVTPEGTVKILDFGLAKAMSGDASTSGPGEATTVSTAATLTGTMPGTILGTAAYMAPEQARGQNVDRRADVWAFGVVLYEMLTGERPFGGATVSDTLAAVLTAAPDLERAPAGARRLLRACLEKDPRRRLESVRDGMLLLEPGEAGGTAPAQRPRAWTVLPWVLFAAALIAAAVAWKLAAPAVQPALTDLSILPPPQYAFNFDPFHDLMALSPDGRSMVFTAAATDGTTYLWLRQLDSATPQRLDGTANAASPFWAPDGSVIGFLQNGELMRMDLNGGQPQPLASVGDLRGGNWSPQGTIVYANGAGPMMQIPAQGGTPAPAMAGEAGAASANTLTDRYPWFLPDGRHFLFARVGGAILLGEIGGSASRVLVNNASSSAVYASGYLLFRRGSVLMAQPFDTKRLALTGAPAPVSGEAVHTTGDSMDPTFSASENGALAFLPAANGAETTLGWFDFSGKLLSTVAGTADAYKPALSPDGRRAVCEVHGNLWILDLSTGARTQFTYGENSAFGIWSPDGQFIYYDSSRGGRHAIYRKRADGSAPEQILFQNSDPRERRLSSISPDGKFLLFTTWPAEYIEILPIEGGGQPSRFSFTEGLDENGQFSPDGHWMAFAGITSEGTQVYVTPFPGPGGVYRVSTGEFNVEPRWSRDGKSLYFVSGGQELMVASVQTQGTAAEIGTPRPLFGPLSLEPDTEYDMTPDGTRVLAVAGSTLPPALTLIQHWPQALTH